ncbi:MAG: hypothetical protein Kow0059_21570 [Candidatus Sumerlaeia bacterium]
MTSSENRQPSGPHLPIWSRPPWSLLFSLKVGIVLLAVVTAASIYGTLIDPLERAQRLVYYSWWYEALLLLLAISMGCTTYRTLMTKVLPARAPRFFKQPQIYRAMRPGAEAVFRGSAQDVAEAFRRRGFRVFLEGPFGYARRGMLSRWGAPVAHTGFIIVLLGGFAAGFVNKEGVVRLVEGGRTATMLIRPDLKTSLDLGFTLVCDDFHTEFFPKTRTPSTFVSTVGVVRDGRRAETGVVEVNRSMVVDGWVLHQTSYEELKQLARYEVTVSGPELREPAVMEVTLGQRRPVPGRPDVEVELPSGGAGRWTLFVNGIKAAEGVRSARSYQFDVLARHQDSGGEGAPPARASLTVGQQAEVTVGGRVWTVKALQFEPDFVIGPDRVATSRSEDLNNPALRVEITAPDGAVRTQWLFGREDLKAAHPGGGSVSWELSRVTPAPAQPPAGAESAPDGQTWSVQIGRRVPAYATVLTLTRNPVIPYIYGGCGVMVLGLLMSFFIRRREVWFWVDEGNARLRVVAQYRHSATQLDAATQAVMASLSATPAVPDDEKHPISVS